MVLEPSPAIPGASLHLKPPFWTILIAGAGAHADVAIVDVAGTPLFGLQEHTELYRDVTVPYAMMALLGDPINIVLIVVV